MTDATTRSPLSRWVLVVFTAGVALAALWLASRLAGVCSSVGGTTSSCAASGRPTLAVIGGVVVVIVAIGTLIATALAPEEVRPRLFALLYACLVILTVLALVSTVASGGFTLPPTFDL